MEMETKKTYRAPHPTHNSGSHSRPCARQGQSSSAQGSGSSPPPRLTSSPPSPSPPQSTSSSARARPLPLDRPPWASSIRLDLARQRHPRKRRAPVFRRSSIWGGKYEDMYVNDVQIAAQRHVRMQCCALMAQTQSTACRVHGPACAQGPTGLAFISYHQRSCARG